MRWAVAMSVSIGNRDTRVSVRFDLGVVNLMAWRMEERMEEEDSLFILLLPHFLKVTSFVTHSSHNIACFLPDHIATHVPQK